MARAVTQAAPTDPFLREYASGGWENRGPGWVRELRASAAAAFARQGLPGPGDERWKGTNLRAIGAVHPRCPTTAGAELTERDLEPYHFPGEATRLVFVDGRFNEALSHVDGLPGSADVEPLSEALKGSRPSLESHLGRHSDPDEPLVALNTMFLDDGAYVDLRSGATVADPIHLLFVSSGASANPCMSHPRVVVLAGERSECTLLETHVGIGSGPVLNNAVVEVLAEPGSLVRHAKVQREGPNTTHLASLHVRQVGPSVVQTFAFHLGGALVRDEVHVHLDGEGAECQVDGLFLGTAHQHVDNQTRIHHNAPRCTSRQLYKGILDGNARGIFTGLVTVRADAQKTSAEQTNRNLLLSGQALMQTTPQLEINADDVKCSHGSTIGRLDEEALFLLRSRGLGPERARLLLTQAFARDVLERIPHAGIRQSIDGLVSSWFAGRKDVERARREPA